MKKINNFVIKEVAGKGKGLFADKDILKGTPLFIAFFRCCEADNMGDGKIFEYQYTQAYPNNFVNHDSNPNVKNQWVGELYIAKVALRDIKKGEEITSDYNTSMDIIKERGFKMDNWLFFMQK